MATGFFLLDNPQALQQYTYPRRNRDKLSGTCIVHTSEWSTDFVGADASAEDCAWYMTRRNTYGAYHTMVDSDSIIEMVPYEYEAWQDSETNNWAVGISASLQAQHWSEVEPNRVKRIYRNLAWAAADFVIYMRDKYHIKVPLKRITGAQARAKVPGFCAHGDSGIGRTDPGKHFDWGLFFKYTAEEIAKRDGGVYVKPAGGVSGSESWFEVIMNDEQKFRAILREELDDSNWRLLTYKGNHPTKKGEKDRRDLYSYIRFPNVDAKAIAKAVWDHQIVSRYDSFKGKVIKYAAEAFLGVNNDRLNTMRYGEKDKTTGELIKPQAPEQPERTGPIIPE